MIFHYAGKYDGDESKLPQKEHHSHAVQFKELEDTKKLSSIANIGGVLTMVLLAIPFLLLGIKYIPDNAIWMMIGGVCGGLSLLPHELLHAICYKEDVYMMIWKISVLCGSIICLLAFLGFSDVLYIMGGVLLFIVPFMCMIIVKNDKNNCYTDLDDEESEVYMKKIEELLEQFDEE